MLYLCISRDSPKKVEGLDDFEQLKELEGLGSAKQLGVSIDLCYRVRFTFLKGNSSDGPAVRCALNIKRVHKRLYFFWF